jgi:rubrerythrin
MEIKGSSEKLCRRYYRMEFIGYGLYNRIASQVEKSKPQMAERLRKVARDEEKHGFMFGKFYQKQFGKNYSKAIWGFVGDVLARLIYPMSTEKKVKKFSDKEKEAVQNLDHAFAGGEWVGDPFLKCLKAIYADELDHSKVYEEFYS